MQYVVGSSCMHTEHQLVSAAVSATITRPCLSISVLMLPTVHK